MEASRRAHERLRAQRALRRRVARDALAQATARRDRALTWGNAGLVARCEAMMRRAERALAALDQADAADAAGERGQP